MARFIGAVSADILKKLDVGMLGMADLFDFLFLSGRINNAYHLGKEDYKAFKRRSLQRRAAMHAEHDAADEKQRFYNLMYRLESQGLITKEKRGVKTILAITQKGIEKYRAFKKQPAKEKADIIPRALRHVYPQIKSPTSIIISFDIPEKEKHKRAWLRGALRNLDFKILHASVWLGENALPKELLDDCRHMKIMRYIHIFAVSKKGTISE